MALTVTDLFTPMTAAQIRAKMVVELVVLQVPADKWRAGGVASTMLTVASILLAMMSAIIVTLIQGFFLPTATGVGLKLLALYMYGVTVNDATYASGNLTLTNTGGGVYSKAIGEYLALNPTTGATYRNTAAFSLGALATVTVPMAAVNAGSGGNAVAGAISASSTPLLGVTVSNPAAFVGVDAPTDAAIRALCTNKTAAQSVRGVRGAYAYSIQEAINPVTLGPVNINRWVISEGSHTGTVTLVVAAPSGSVDANDLTGIETSVEANARPNGAVVVVSAANPVPYAPNITIYAMPNALTVTLGEVKDACDSAVLAYIADFPIGGVTASDDTNTSFEGLFGDGVKGAIAAGCTAAGATLQSVKGASDLALGATDVASNSVALSVVLLPKASGILT